MTRPRRLSPQAVRLLAYLLLDPTKEHYGNELCRALDLATGTVYPLLQRFEAAGWLESSWEADDPSRLGRPRMRLYRLTGDGARTAAMQLAVQRPLLTPVQPRAGLA